MDNDKKLFEELLKTDGIDPKAPTESELTSFRKMLDNEQKRMKRLSCLNIGIVWIFASALIGLSLFQNLLEGLGIPVAVGSLIYTVVSLVVVVPMLIVIIRYLPRYYRKLRESNQKIRKLYYRANGKHKHRCFPLVSRKNGKRVIHWFGILRVIANVWVIWLLVSAGFCYLLYRQWLFSSTVLLTRQIIYCTIVSLSFVIYGLRTGLKAPLEELTEIKTKPKLSKPGIVRPDIWRIIMQSKITKLTAAAAIILVAITIVNQFGGSIDVATVAWADVVEEINNYTKYKCRQRVVRQDGTYFPTMDVYHLNLSLRRQEVEDGSIHIIDMRGTDAITVELYPAERKAIVTNLIGAGPRKDPHIIKMVKRFEQESTERLGTKEVDGKILQGFRHVPNKYNDYTVWVDPETKLPVEIEIKHTKSPMGQTIFMDEFEFDFELDPSAFSTEIPDGYEVETITLDYRPVEPKDITAEDIRSKLNHTAYTVKKLPWMEKIITIETIDPLGTKSKVYVTAILSDDGNTIIIVQGDLYDEARMVWIPNQQLVLETPSGIELYTHPNGAIYAKLFLESFAKAKPEFFDIKNLSEERFTRMIVMPDRMILSLSANKQMSDEKVQEIVESLTEIQAN